MDTIPYGAGTGGNSLKLKEKRFRLDIGIKLFPVMVVKPWHRVAAPGSMEVSKARLDGAWSNLG